MDQFFSQPADNGNSENKKQGFGWQTSQEAQKQHLKRPQMELPNGATFEDYFRLLTRRGQRIWTALKWQFHEKTWHAFKKQSVRRATLFTLTGFFLWNTEPTFFVKLGQPIVQIFQSKSVRFGDDYPQTEFSMSGGSAFLKPEGKASARKMSGNAFLGGDGGNAAAPVGASQLREQEAREYIEKYGKIAQTEMQKFGIPASIALAQGLVESRAGTSRLARGNNNHFGMKCFSKKCPKGHCTNATDDHHKDFFRKYNSSWESWREHSKLISSGHYLKLKKCGNDYRQWAFGLKSLGYATDRTYAEKLISMIDKYELYRFDK